MFDKNKKTFVKRIHLVIDDGLYDQKAFYKVKIVFIDADIISFFVASKSEKIQKIDKNN